MNVRGITHCSICKKPAHASETDDLDRHPACVATERAIQAVWDRCSDGFMSEEAAEKAEAALRADAGLVRMTLILTEEVR